MKRGWELQAKSHFKLIAQLRGTNLGGHWLRAGIVLESDLLGIGRPVLSGTLLYAPRPGPRQPKATSLATQAPQSGSRAAQKGPQSRPKRGKGARKTPEGEHQILNLYTHKIYANSRPTAIQRPAITPVLVDNEYMCSG